MRRNIFLLFLGFLFILVSSGSSLFAEESITITTYYPSPYGSYNQLYVADKLGIGTTTPLTDLDILTADSTTAPAGLSWPGLLLRSDTNVYNSGPTLMFGVPSGPAFAVKTHATNGAISDLVFYRQTDPAWLTTAALSPMVTFQGGNGNVGIGTRWPDTIFNVYSPGNGIWLSHFQNGTSQAYFAHSSGYGMAIESGSLASASTYSLFISHGGAFANPDLYVGGDGNVGIGTSSPTARLEVVCPAGFTNVKGGTPVNQLGCMQTAEQGTGTWLAASNTCFTTYGGRLPSRDEWYVTMNNYALTGETGNWEWVNDACQWIAGAYYLVVGNTTIAQSYSYVDTDTYAYRCWIPR